MSNTKTEIYFIKRFHNFKRRKEYWWKTTNLNNGQLIAGSKEGYWNKTDCEHNIKITMTALVDYLKNR